jgi:hypothetical protein
VGEPLLPFRSLREILLHVLSLHVRRIGGYAAGSQDDHRRAAVMTFLRAREAELVAAIARYSESQDDVLRTYVQNVPASLLAVAAVDGPDAADDDLDAVLGDYRVRGQALIALFEQLVAAVGPRAGAILANLAAIERRSQQQLQQAMLDF